ncbi:MAG TPA: heavy metal-binding domain-containing protein [Hyphomonadaceae bacterium]|jgi:hypothetical protein|nr:heavy metal-binding domain-containing protein [Hyphomonadaceae bacterium]
MQTIDRRRVFMTMAMLGVVLLGVPGILTAEAAPAKKWVCPPCGCAADGKEFDAPGRCPDCGMDLIEKPEDKPSPPATAPVATQPKPAEPAKDPKAAAPATPPAQVQPPQ